MPCIPFFRKGDKSASAIPTSKAINPTLVYTSMNADF